METYIEEYFGVFFKCAPKFLVIGLSNTDWSASSMHCNFTFWLFAYSSFLFQASSDQITLSVHVKTE